MIVHLQSESEVGGAEEFTGDTDRAIADGEPFPVLAFGFADYGIKFLFPFEDGGHGEAVAIAATKGRVVHGAARQQDTNGGKHESKSHE